MLRRRIVILMLHGVMDNSNETVWNPLRHRLSPDKLEEFMAALAKHYHFVSLQDAVDMLQGKRPVRPYSLVLTFDDGYRNNITHALPVLRRFNAPVTFFIATGFVDQPKPFWFDRLDYALQHISGDCREVTVAGQTVRIRIADRDALRASYSWFRTLAKAEYRSDVEFLQTMSDLAECLEGESGKALKDVIEDDGWASLLTWPEIEAASKESYVCFGSHTVDHIRLGLVDERVARDQLARSKHSLEQHTSRPCLCLCYPNGSFTDETVELVREGGYVCGVTTEDGLNGIGNDVMKLHRINVPADVSSHELLARACGLSQVLSRAKKVLACLLCWRNRFPPVEKTRVSTADHGDIPEVAAVHGHDDSQ